MIALRLTAADLDELADLLAPRIVSRMPQPEAPTTRLLTSAQTARMGGWPTRKAFEMALTRARKRGERHPLEAMAIDIDGARRWREADVVAWIETRRAAGGAR